MPAATRIAVDGRAVAVRRVVQHPQQCYGFETVATPARSHNGQVNRCEARWRLAAAFSVLLVVTLVPMRSSVADCPDPYFAAIKAADGRSLHSGSLVTVEGAAFSSECNDTGSQGVFSSCSAPEAATYESVPLSIKQGQRAWELADSELVNGAKGRVSWQVRLPDDLHPGAASFRAYIAQTESTIVTSVTITR